MEDLSYLTTEYARSKMIEEYQKGAKMGDIADDLIQDGIDAMIEDGASWKEIVDVINPTIKRKRKGGNKMKRQFFIAGVQFRPRPEIDVAAKQMEVGDKLILTPEPTNKFDPNAVKIETELENTVVFLGYVPKKFSSEVTALLSIDAPIICIVDEVNPAAKTYEMFKVTISIPIEEDDNGTFEDHLEDID